MGTEDTRKARNRRLTVVAVLLALGLAGVLSQLIRYQVFRHDELQELSDQQVVDEVRVPSQRGYIADISGHLLAMDLTEWDIAASPPYVTDADGLAKALSPLLEIPVDELRSSLSSKSVPWVQLKTQVPQQVGQAVVDLHGNGIECVPKSKRVYPEGSLTAHVVGIVNATGAGFYGVEGYHNQELKPVVGVTEVELDPIGREIPAPPRQQNPARRGTSLILTLDLNIQYIAEQELERALEQFGAKSGTILIMEPRSGAILASVSYPRYDPNHFADVDASVLQDPAVSSMWEPGSIFKVITWGAGLDSGSITPEATYYDDGAIEVGGRAIRNWDLRGHGAVTMDYGLAHSLNVVAAHISTTVGKERFYTYLRRFGFGGLTGVDLASEGPGMIRLPGDTNWFPSDLGTNSFGQGIAVTPMQMITAVAAVANRGLLMKPHIVRDFIVPDADGEGSRLVRVEPMAVRRAISEQAASTLRGMMVNAVDTVVTKAQVPGYRIAGKSATAQIPTAYGYHPTDTIASYVGFAPAEDPRFVVLVKLDKPKTSEWGTQTAAPTFQAIASRLFLYLEIPPDEVRVAQGSE
jgi:cell division protein FtsI/penicillin-binding protein 2